MNAVLYVHGKGGNASESDHYEPLFPARDVFGLDYKTFTPWETGEEIRAAVKELKEKCENVILIANSVGAFFSMCADISADVERAYFISPIVDMEKLIRDMMTWANVDEEELFRRGVIRTAFGEDLSWDYLCYVRKNPIKWNVKTHILYGENDNLTSLETVHRFASEHGATLTVMKGGEHWFHTDEQMNFIDQWIKNTEKKYEYGN